MIEPTSPVAYFDRLPDEILLKILNYAMQRDAPFFPEYCAKFIRDGRRHRPIEPDWGLDSSQRVHLADWRMINTTSRRIRNLGREAFFGWKDFAMSSSFPASLRSGSAFPGSITDQELALRYIRSIVVVDLTIHLSSVLIRLPKMSHAFPKLERIRLLFGYRNTEPLELLYDAQSVHDGAELKLLLGKIGFNNDLMPTLEICKDLDWVGWERMLGRDVYPVLKARADMLRAVDDRS